MNKGVSGFGADARFGPEGSPFANRFFGATIYNNTIYQLTADGGCTPFVTFDGKPWGEPAGLAFSADGQRMFVTVTKGNTLGSAEPEGAVVSIAADGTVDKKPVVEGLSRPMGMARAPASFGVYAGQLFITDGRKMEIPVPMTQPLTADGKLYRVTTDGKLHLVASGFVNPVGLEFVDNALWVTDINGDFIAGKRELPDGFIVKIRAQ
jgi:sugar lactone lactonase YvrE